MSELHRTSKDFTLEERARLLEQFRLSGLSFQDFAKEHNINPSTFKNWKWLSEKPAGQRLQRTPVERKKIVAHNKLQQASGARIKPLDSRKIGADELWRKLISGGCYQPCQ